MILSSCIITLHPKNKTPTNVPGFIILIKKGTPSSNELIL